MRSTELKTSARPASCGACRFARCCLIGVLLASLAGSARARGDDEPYGGETPAPPPAKESRVAPSPAALAPLPAALAPPPAIVAARTRASAVVDDHGSGARVQAQLARRIARLTPAGATPCALHAALEIGRQTLAACGGAGVWVLELGGSSGDRVIERRTVAGRAVGLFLRKRRVWVEVETLDARPLDELPRERTSGAAAGARTPLRLAPEPSDDMAVASTSDAARVPLAVAIVGHVVSAPAGRLVVDLGLLHGARVGSRVELATTSDSSLGMFREREVLSVGNIVAIRQEQSLVELGMGETVPVGAEALLTSRDSTSSRWAPPRVARVATVAGVVRPFFVLDRLGFGAISELSIGYRARAPIHYRVLASPLAASSAGDGRGVSTIVLGLVSFDTHVFEIGVGFGAQTVNDSDHEPGGALSLAQSLRFGAEDGLRLSLRNAISLFHGEFAYSALEGEAQVPVVDRGWLVLQGGGGRAGYALGEIGGKVLVVGNGTPGSLFLRGTIGYARVYDDASSGASDTHDGIDHAGPLVGFGVEWRR
jgi:hypothetical protein